MPFSHLVKIGKFPSKNNADTHFVKVSFFDGDSCVGAISISYNASSDKTLLQSKSTIKTDKSILFMKANDSDGFGDGLNSKMLSLQNQIPRGICLKLFNSTALICLVFKLSAKAFPNDFRMQDSFVHYARPIVAGYCEAFRKSRPTRRIPCRSSSAVGKVGRIESMGAIRSDSFSVGNEYEIVGFMERFGKSYAIVQNGDSTLTLLAERISVEERIC